LNDLKIDIEAGLDLLPTIRKADSARVLLYATSRQENPTRSPRQIIKDSETGKLVPKGPAVGDYQFEKTGIRGVLNFYRPSVPAAARAACAARGVAPTVEAVFDALQVDPVLAAAFARLLYFTDSGAMPAVGDEPGAWAVYLRTWRPGAYARQPEQLRSKWRKSYAEAMQAYGLL